MTESEKLTEDIIFEAATDVFLDKGLDGTRMQDIADHAGINKALLHYYFRTKERLFEAVFTKLATKMFSKFQPIFEKDLSIEEKIRFFYKEHITFMQQNPKIPAFVLNEINHNPRIIKNFFRNMNVKKIWTERFEHHQEELKKYNITFESLPQIMTSIAAISVFPFAAKGILEEIFKSFNVDFDTFIEERKDFAAEFVINALRK